MDLLLSLNISELPEQQTRSSHLLKDYPEFDLKLGFDSCCYCGKKNPDVECVSCRRVKYCSNECRQSDASPIVNGDDENDEQALGHTSVICSLLNLCNDDDAMVGQGGTENSNRLKLDQRNAAVDRQASEFESYPATLANVLMEAPPYQETLKECSGRGLTIHVIGASEDSELWKGHPNPNQEKQVFRGYADALAEISEQYRLPWICLHFFGPELPTKPIEQTLPIPLAQANTSSSSLAKLLVRTFRINYGMVEQGSNALTTTTEAAALLPDVAVFFNPGFTCTEYDWEGSLSFFKTHPTPFLVATNTEMEAIADIQYLKECQLFEDVPAGLKSLLFHSGDNEDDDEDEDTTESPSFFSINPYAGLRVRQNQTMANDLYVKSRWIFGGISGKTKTKRTIKRSASATVTKGEESSKKRRLKGSGNCKTSNPALI
jgi:hypothetical protein